MLLRPHMRSALAAALLASTPFPREAFADVLPVAGPCVPGLTAARCRGTFWETGKLYRKDVSGGALSVADYETLLRTLDQLRVEISSLLALADSGDVDGAGAEAARVRASLRQTGERVTRALAGDERYESDQRLLATLRLLDEADAASLKSKGNALPPGFEPVSINLKNAQASFDAFRSGLPSLPAEDP